MVESTLINPLREGDALLLVDVQNDFFPGGPLPIPDGGRILPVLNRWTSWAEFHNALVYASRDWHPIGHTSFVTDGGEWPSHCIQDTTGAAFHPDLYLPPAVIKVSKGNRFDRDQFSAFNGTGLEAHMQRHGVRRLWVGGLAQDGSVLHTVLDARRLGFEVHLIPGGSRPHTIEGGREALEWMRTCGAWV
jgi:nicotinamidase/pyrazinamidase